MAVFGPTGTIIHPTGTVIHPTDAIIRPTAALIGATGSIMVPTRPVVDTTGAITGPTGTVIGATRFLIHLTGAGFEPGVLFALCALRFRHRHRPFTGATTNLSLPTGGFAHRTTRTPNKRIGTPSAIGSDQNAIGPEAVRSELRSVQAGSPRFDL